jgi:hypothetical protein
MSTYLIGFRAIWFNGASKSQHIVFDPPMPTVLIWKKSDALYLAVRMPMTISLIQLVSREV